MLIVWLVAAGLILLSLYIGNQCSPPRRQNHD